ncbi:MAG: tetratricopeptide repeat protein [Planctomycetes bacterium]|nr:tetratricopeptide repeat protein [Planctomycetota bacterium]
MQPYTAAFARASLTLQGDRIRIGASSYRAEIGRGQGSIVESDPNGQTRHAIAHVMGGKNVYYFLAAFPGGRLQTLPLAYDVRRKEWFDMAGSGVRHVPGLPADEALSWTDSAYTFNTSCYRCHVSQLSTNYDGKTDIYHTVWAEPGINCETCHGPAAEHVRVCREAAQGRPPSDLRIARYRDFTGEQTSTTCAPCHARMRPLTTTFQPGDRYFDHYDLVTLEDPDFHPDGRDLGENYTYTLWRMSPCVQSGQLDCVYCHTSSGRYRHRDDPNRSCLPCHQERVAAIADHAHHPAGSAGAWCISCHMPTTEFARMRRSDHSMRPPTPAATVAFQSPNACNLCHADKDAAWADRWVHQWHPDDFQAPVVRRAGWIAAARKGDWQDLASMLAYVTSADREEITATALIRLLVSCADERKFPALLQALNDVSPLVRSAAAQGLAGRFTPSAVEALARAATDSYRLVRTQAAHALAGLPPEWLPADARAHVARARDELLASWSSRPDDWSSHYNLGNLWLTQGEAARAVTAFETATRLRPDAVMPLVNAAIAYSRLGREPDAERALRRALALAPASAAVNFNLGLLLAGRGDRTEAERRLRAACEADPNLAPAAYNLGVLLAGDGATEGIDWLRQAVQLEPDSQKYAYTLAFHFVQRGELDEACGLLERLIARSRASVDEYTLLGAAYERLGNTAKAAAVYLRAAADESLPPEARRQFAVKSRTLAPPGKKQEGGAR